MRLRNWKAITWKKLRKHYFSGYFGFMFFLFVWVYAHPFSIKSLEYIGCYPWTLNKYFELNHVFFLNIFACFNFKSSEVTSPHSSIIQLHGCRRFAYHLSNIHVFFFSSFICVLIFLSENVYKFKKYSSINVMSL